NTEFADGHEIDTSNSSTVNVFYKLPQRTATRIPHLKDLDKLCYVHSYLVRQRDGKAILPEPGKEVEHLDESVNKSLRQQAELGLLFLDEKTQRYRHTWKGAIRSTWRLLWPAKPIIKRSQEREVRRMAAEAARAG